MKTRATGWSSRYFDALMSKREVITPRFLSRRFVFYPQQPCIGVRNLPPSREIDAEIDEHRLVANDCTGRRIRRIQVTQQDVNFEALKRRGTGACIDRL